MARRVGSPNYSGKVAEAQFKKSVENAGGHIIRLVDATIPLPGGKVHSVKSPSDFIFYYGKGKVLHAFMAESKASGGVSISFDMLKEHQNAHLCEMEVYHNRSHGVVAVNLYDKEDVRKRNQLFIVPIGVWNEYANSGKRKSLALSECEDDERIIECPRIAGSMWDITPYLDSL